MKKIFIVLSLCSLFACSDDDVDLYTIDADGKVVVSKDSKNARSFAKFKTYVCGSCWRCTKLEYPDGTPNDILGTPTCYYEFNEGVCIRYTEIIPSFPPGTKYTKEQCDISYNEESGTITSANGHVVFTILSISDNQILGFDDFSAQSGQIQTYVPMDIDDYNQMISEL